ncbi:class I SAM-dependent methyltransferase [Cohnella sp.]|uniref:class I SAM-dependent methyltransferase n=1 Tax=Cohnella sp. TaxID=1883426 RepID=UPI00356344B4
MLRNEDVYHHISAPYDVLVSKEDRFNNIPRAITDITTLEGKNVLDIGAGTGRLTRMIAPHVSSIQAVDFAADMLKLNAVKLVELGLDNWKTTVADLRELPVKDQEFDLIVAGWSICYVASSNSPDWKENLKLFFSEVRRVLKPGGKIIIFETMGTGVEKPNPPHFLLPYFESLERDFGLQKKVIQTDFHFDTVEQAETLCRDFFGDEVGDDINRKESPIVPSWTGVWWSRL